MKLVYISPLNPNSHLTTKERKELSFPARYLHSKGLLKGRILDFGCGLGDDVRFLRDYGYDVIGYDPKYAPEIPLGKFDTILCFYVLNVLLPEEQAHTLMAISELLDISGRAFFSVRRDIAKDGFRIHVKHRVEVYQCNVHLPFTSLFINSFCEIYQYQHINQQKWKRNKDCPFCSPTSDRDLITESASSYSIYDKFPVSPGHALVIPKIHEGCYFSLSSHARTSCWVMVNRVKEIVEEKFHPDGFNIGINVGTSAGQTIPHVHIHLIPRYVGDVDNPTGGVRNVILEFGDYLHHNKST